MTGAMDGSDIDDELLRVDSGGFCRVWDEARVPVLYPGTLTGAAPCGEDLIKPYSCHM